MRPTALFGDRLNDERERLQLRLAERIRANMASLIENSGSAGHHPTADLLLVAADGRKLAAHTCVLRQRAPVFFSRHIQPTLDATPRGHQHQQRGALMEIAIGEVDSAGLEFFIRSVYTDEEVKELSRPSSQLTADRSGSGGGGGADGGSGRELQSHAPGFSERRSSPKLSSPDSLNARGNRGPENEWNLCGLVIDGKRVANGRGEGSRRTQKDRAVDEPRRESNSIRTRDDGPEPIMAMTSFKTIASQKPTTTTPCHNSATLPRCSVSGVGVEALGRHASPSDTKLPGGGEAANKSIFSMFIGIDEDDQSAAQLLLPEDDEGRDVMSQSFPRHNAHHHYNLPLLQSMSSSFAGSSSSIRSRILAARKLSMSSLSSLASIDASPSDSVQLLDSTPFYMADRNPPSQLASDLLRMYLNGEDCDCIIKVDDGELHAHRCILWASCPHLRAQLQQPNSGTSHRRIELKGYDKAHIHFLLSFLYGGLTCITEELDVWELLRIAEEIEVDGLIDVILLHLRAYKFHCFHRPCAGCVSAAFDMFPQLNCSSTAEVRGLCKEILTWQAQNFHRVWKSRVFMHLAKGLQKECFNALLESITEENVIEVLLGCEKLQVGLSRMKLQQHAQAVQTLVADVAEYCTEFLVTSLDSLIQSESFSASGMDLALNLPFLEDILPPLVHALSADVAVRTYLNLQTLVRKIASSHGESTDGGESRATAQWNPRFLRLCRRLFELCDRHLLHYAAAVVKCDSWPLLDKWNQTRVLEAGIFVEMNLPKAPLPNFSSLHRPYNRSSSARLHSKCDRTRSLERTLVDHASQQALQQHFQPPMKEVGMEKEAQLPPTEVIPAERDTAIRHSATTTEENAAPQCPQSRIPSLSHVHTVTYSTSSQPARTRVDNRPRRTTRRRTPVGTKKQQANHPGVNDDIASLRRQNTHTVMTAQQNREAGIRTTEMAVTKNEVPPPATSPTPPPRSQPPNTNAQVPRPMPAVSPKIPSSLATPIATKPRSVVRPMPKAVDMKAVATPTNAPPPLQPSIEDALPRAAKKSAPKSTHPNQKVSIVARGTKIPTRPSVTVRITSTSQRNTTQKATGRKAISGRKPVTTTRRSTNDAIIAPLRTPGAKR